MVTIPWLQLGGLYAPAAFAYLELDGAAPAGAPTLVVGMLDSGATVTTLRTDVEQPRLGVNDQYCIPMRFGVANGQHPWFKLTMTTARLDGHEFRLPIVFADAVSPNLIGRVGISDQFEIRLDPTAHQSHFAWKGPLGGQGWASLWEVYWQAMLNLGYTWPNWHANGSPPIPPPPTFPAGPLPPLA